MSTQNNECSVIEGVVERKSLRGNYTEYSINCCESTLIVRRELDESPLEEGKKVDIFIRRIFVTKGDEVQLLKNNSLHEESVVI